jgi:hypothetical protein
MWWLAIGGAGVFILALLFLDGRRREQTILRNWELALTPRGERAIQTLRDDTGANLALVDLTYDRALDAAAAGDMDQALRMLDAGCRLIEGYCPTMLRSLAAMSVLSRMVAAVAPVRPLRPAAFQLRQLTQLAYLNRFVHHFLVTTSERFRLRLFIIGRGFLTIVRVVAQTTAASRTSPEVKPLWDHLDAARRDVRTLTDETVEAFRVLVMSLAAERKA